MSKYQKLTSHLSLLQGPRWTAPFREIETILGFSLPKSAYSYPAWWSNQAGEGHSQSVSWQSIGWRTGDLDLAARHVTFFRQLPNSHNLKAITTDPHSGDNDDSVSTEAKHGLTIAEAKAGLSVYFDVPPGNIEITIKG
jgi:hypothetical protein